jgi:hypothetical protein
MRKELTWKRQEIEGNNHDYLSIRLPIRSNIRKDGRYFILYTYANRRIRIEQGGYASGLRHTMGYVNSIRAAKIVCNLSIK